MLPVHREAAGNVPRYFVEQQDSNKTTTRQQCVKED